eukprot:SM000027S09679  [mRNA]  locus=s27:698791:708220:+ [translate_table: standard]
MPHAPVHRRPSRPSNAPKYRSAVDVGRTRACPGYQPSDQSCSGLQMPSDARAAESASHPSARGRKDELRCQAADATARAAQTPAVGQRAATMAKAVERSAGKGRPPAKKRRKSAGAAEDGSGRGAAAAADAALAAERALAETEGVDAESSDDGGGLELSTEVHDRKPSPPLLADADASVIAARAATAAEPPKDYIHVRARRGQATDSHSLAERVRREKISERMRVLQGLVPTCSRVTGKAVMLDEIINYVRSLQLQVALLSKKLAAIRDASCEEEDESFDEPVLYARPSPLLGQVGGSASLDATAIAGGAALSEQPPTQMPLPSNGLGPPFFAGQDSMWSSDLQQQLLRLGFPISQTMDVDNGWLVDWVYVDALPKKDATPSWLDLYVKLAPSRSMRLLLAVVPADLKHAQSRTMSDRMKLAESLPADLAAAVTAGRVPGFVVERYAALEGSSPLLRWLLGFAGFRERLLADDLFLTKVAIECGVGIFTKTAAELERRRENFVKELDFVIADIIMALVADFMLVWLPAPTINLRGAPAAGVGALRRFLLNCPDNAFQVAMGGRSYTLLQRSGAIARNGAKLLAVGTSASLFGTGMTNVLIAGRKLLDKSYVGEVDDVPILATSLAYGVYMAVSSNLRYQILAGVVEQRLLEPFFHDKKLALSALSFAVRTGNTFLGSLMWVDYARFVGVQ